MGMDQNKGTLNLDGLMLNTTFFWPTAKCGKGLLRNLMKIWLEWLTFPSCLPRCHRNKGNKGNKETGRLRPGHGGVKGAFGVSIFLMK